MLLTAGKDASQPVGATAECSAYTEAAQLLNLVVTSIKSDEVLVESIKIITCNRSNFEELVKCYYGQPNAKAHVDCSYILQKTQELVCDVARFEEMRRSVLFVSRKCLDVLPANCDGKG